MRRIATKGRGNDHTATNSASGLETVRANRRIVLRAAAGVAALAASGIGVAPGPARIAAAQESGGTRAERFVPDSETLATAASGEWATFEAAYPFWALGASWDGTVGEWPVIQVQVSEDGVTWSDTVQMAAQTEDGGQPTRDDRLFTALIFTSGESFVRFQTTDIAGVPGTVSGLSFLYIDPTDGPWEDDLSSVPQPAISAFTLNDDTLAPPEIVTRAQWGANETWRFASFGEIWPPEYETVSHIIVHHTATANRPVDVPGAIRSIYYYHAVEQEWGDIGYNYLVDHNGRIYQGRYGGQDVIGGHAFQYAVGSSGISVIGNFMSTSLPEAAKSALVSISAWVGRDLDLTGGSDFHEAPELPTISSHRDVNGTSCPGNMLWNELPSIRQLAAQTLDTGVLETGAPAGIAPGDRVRVQTDTGGALNIRSSANGTVTGSIANGDLAWVTDGPTTTGGANWYQIDPIDSGPTGWVSAAFLIVDPPPFPGDGTGYPFGLNIRFASTGNLRRGPTTSAAVVASVPANSLAYVMMGPLEGDGLDWYQVRVMDVADGWVASSLIEPVPFDDSPAAAFAIGDYVVTTQSVNVRARPGLAQGVTASAPSGATFEVTVAPVAVNGYVWYGAYGAPYGGGWIVENYLRETTPPPAGKFEVGDSIRVTERMNLRSAPSTSGSVVLSMPAGTTATVLAGPRTANGYTWWQIRTSGGTTGWAVQDWLVETTTTPPPTGKFEVGDSIRVSERLNLRSAANTSGSVIAVLQPGVTGSVIAGPSTGSGYTWYRIQTSQGTGWAVQDWLEETTTTPPPTGKFDIGDAVQVSERLNLRSSASTSGSIVAILQPGVVGTVLAGPSAGSGYTWWQIQTSQGTGWAVQDWLVERTTTPPPTEVFEVGDAVRVTERINLRSAAGTSASVVTILNVGATGTILGGPTIANGYTWWQIRTSGGSTGWCIEDGLGDDDGSTPPGTYPAGAIVQTTDPNVRLRASASTSATIIASLPQGHRLTIVSGPTSAGGYSWYRATSATVGTGYIVSEFISAV